MLKIERMISPYNHYEGNAIKYIVVHGTGAPEGTDSARNNAIYFYGGNRNASAHYFVDATSIYQSVEDFNGSWSVGDGYNQHGINNQNTLNIEMCCNNYEYDEETIINTLALVKAKQKEYGIPDSNVVRHFDASRKVCPEYFSPNNWEKWSNFIERLTGETVQQSKPVQKPSYNSGEGKYLNLHSHMEKWAIYATNVRPVTGNQKGYLKPKMFGGLSYKIIEDRGDVKIINTGDYGTVQIYAPTDADSSITDKPIYNNIVVPNAAPPVINVSYLNLHEHNYSWRVYPLNVSPVIGNECGSLAPQRYGGLTYKIVENKGDIKIIDTQTFGRVQIYAPNDADSDVTNYPRY